MDDQGAGMVKLLKWGYKEEDRRLGIFSWQCHSLLPPYVSPQPCHIPCLPLSSSPTHCLQAAIRKEALFYPCSQPCSTRAPSPVQLKPFHWHIKIIASLRANISKPKMLTSELAVLNGLVRSTGYTLHSVSSRQEVIKECSSPAE